MNTAEIVVRADGGIEDIALELEGGDDESRIRRTMRVNPALRARKTGRTPSRRLVGGVALVASGFCLGWKAFRFWHD